MNMSATLKELATAMAKAQAAIEGAKKDVTNTFFKSKYADLSSVVEAIRGPLATNGLSYVQVAHEKPDLAAVETIILHSSGEWLSCGVLAVPVAKADAQGFGSAMTYARRYSLSAAFGVAPEDDDGNAAAKAPPTKAFETSHKPTDGAWDSLTADQQTVVFDLSNRLRSMLAAKESIPSCCDEVDETLNEFEWRNEMKTALYDKLSDLSALRNGMKAEWKARREKATA